MNKKDSQRKGSMASKKRVSRSGDEVRKYLKSVPTGQWATLEKIRKLIKESAPEATEAFSYGIPGFKYKGKPLIWYAAFENHYSLFPTGAGVEALKSELKSYETSKGTIHLPVDKPVPVSLIRKIIKTRMKQIENASEK